jgi:hypothetical protein
MDGHSDCLVVNALLVVLDVIYDAVLSIIVHHSLGVELKR